MEYLARFVSRLIDPSEEGLKDATERLMARLVAALSLKRVKLDNGETIPKQVKPPSPCPAQPPPGE